MAPLASRSRLPLAAGAVALLLSATAEAAVTRYVATYGNNSNNCTLNAPCRTLQRAVNQAPDDGAVIVLDSGHFGNSLHINKSITISADGVTATLRDPGGITVDNADAVVVLRRLHLKGAGAAGVSGISVQNAAAVHIERCTIESFSAQGIAFFAANGELFVTDSIARDNSNNGLSFGGTGKRLTVDASRFENNGASGVFVGGARSTITRSIASGNDSSGISQSAGRMNVTWTTAAQNGSSGYLAQTGGRMTLESSAASGNVADGLYVRNESRVWVSRSVFSGNGNSGIRIEHGNTVQTYETSVLGGNGANLVNSGTITTPVPF